MAKKFGKFLLFTAAIGSAAAAIYYCVHKKNAERDSLEEEDYDDFSNDTKEESDASRSYVPLNPDTPSQEAAEEQEAPSAQEDPEEPAGSFTPLAEDVAQKAESTDETVEEFFDEEDTSDEEPPISSDN